MSDYLDLSWEETVITRIERSINSSFGLVEDPDNLLSEQVLTGLVRNGWGVTSVTNLMELRFEYEDQVRQVSPDLVTHKIFIIRFPFIRVSYDIFKEGDHLQISLRDFFPYLSYNVTRSLPAFWRPVIFRNQSERLHKQQPLSDIETVNFIIRDCLGLDFSTNPTYVDILSLMADMALHRLEVPAKLTSVLQTQLSDSTFSPLFEYMDAPGKTVQFLRTVWEKYIQFELNKSLGVSDEVADEVAKSVTYLDKNREFQTKMTALIAENILPPADIKAGAQLPNWMHLGVHYFTDKTAALREALEQIAHTIPGEQASFNDWINFAFHWAEQMIDYHQIVHTPQEIHDIREKLVAELDQKYFVWLQQQYPALVMQPYLPSPVCVHHVLNHISSVFKPSTSHPIALVVVDGMAVQDWLIVQSDLRDANPSWKFNINGVFALVPTMTSVSRQAMLSGSLPRYFEKSWLNTNSEEMYWRSFWEEKGLNSKTIAYMRGLGGQNAFQDSELALGVAVEEILNQPHLSVAAFIVNTIDELVHTSLLGEKELLNRVHQWAFDRQYLRILISGLFERFEVVIITSDHGHVAGRGIGDFSLSSVAEKRALRARVFHDPVFENLIGEIHEITIWQNTGLPENALVVLPEGRGLFAKKGYSGISHGGASIEETIVPYITITK